MNSGHDVTLHAGDTLRFFRSLVEPSPLAFLLTEGPAHLVCCVNSALSRLFGEGADSLVGRPFADVLPPSFSGQATELLDHVYRTGEPRHAEDLGGVDAERRAVFWRLAV